MLVEVKIGALIMDPNTNTPIVVLKGIDSETVLPIWVGAFEANAIALEIEKIVPQRPMTHDLLRNLIIECGLSPSRVVVTDLLENTFFHFPTHVGSRALLVKTPAFERLPIEKKPPPIRLFLGRQRVESGRSEERRRAAEKQRKAKQGKAGREVGMPRGG